MLAAGYLENGRQNEAEEIGNRAIGKNKGSDLWGMQTLMSTYHSIGRTSEALATLDQFDYAWFETQRGPGKYYLMFQKGSSLIKRGNYNGALRVFEEMLYFYDSSPEFQLVLGLQLSTLLLWQVIFHNLRVTLV